MESNNIILLLCAMVIVSYLFEIMAKRTGIPSVLFLILSGVGLNRIAGFFDTPAIDYLRLIPVVGTVGLIFIVFEGALEIEYSSEKKGLLLKVLGVSVLLLMITAAALTFFFRYKTGADFYRCFLNSIPFSIISSAIAIPSAVHLSAGSREFITLESSFSDIMGIILFNYAVTNTSFSISMAGTILLEVIIVTLVSLIFCMLLLYLLKSIEHNIKFILILAVLVFLYSLGKSIHVSSLIMVLMFGIILKNINLLKVEFIRKHFNNLKFINDFNFLQQITAEGVFLVKTFFFIIFGFIIHPLSLLKTANIETAFFITCIIFSVRVAVMIVMRIKVFPEVFFAPRGLISVLLFLSVPAGIYIDLINIDVLFLVVIISSVIMILGSLRRGRTPGN